MKRSVANLAAELRADIATRKAVAALSAGGTSGLGLLVSHVAFASLVFSGALAPYASQGVGLILFGCFAACLVMALAGGYRGTIAALSPALVVGMAAIAASMDAEGRALFVSVAVALILSAVLVGILCLMVGWFRLANLVRFVPFPVAAGFVAGIGGAVCLAAMSMMGARPDWTALDALFTPATLWNWVPGVVYGIALYWAMKRWRNPLTLPVSVALAVGAYHLAFAALGIPSAQAREMGMLLTSTADGNLWPALGIADLAHTEWTAIAKQMPNMLALILVAVVAVVMNIAGLEVAAGEELDWDQEFRASGLASLVAGIGGGTVATIVVPATLRSKLIGATTRLTGVASALVLAVALALGDGMLQFVPTALVGGILVFAGLGMLDEGLVRSYQRLPPAAFAIVALIFATIIAFGLLEGVAVGMLAALVLFVVRLSRVDPIESRFTARERHSSKARPVPERAILLEEGDRALGYRLRGYIFFGSVHPLADHLGEAMRGHTPPACLMLDFAAVSGVDYSAVNALCRLLDRASASGVQLVLSSLSDHLMRQLQRDLSPSTLEKAFFEPDADHALERGEEVVLGAWEGGGREDEADQRRTRLLDDAVADLERHLTRQIRFEELVDELDDWLEAREYAAGDFLHGPQSPPEGLQLLVAGRASAYDAEGSRLYQCEPGQAVRPALGALAEKVSSVVADGPCRTLVMTPVVRDWLEANRPQLMLGLYGLLLDGQFPAEAE